MTSTLERSVRQIIRASVQSFADGFALRHIDEKDDPDGVINMKIHNIFIAALGKEIQYYSALARSLDSFFNNIFFGKLAINIAMLQYEVSQHVEGVLYKEQTDYIAELLEDYKNHAAIPKIADYKGISTKKGTGIHKRHESDYYLIDRETGMHYLIELKIGGDLDNKKARSEKEALLEQYCILTNELGSEEQVKILFATAYNRYGEGEPWRQGRILQFFSEEELCISKSFWNLVCKSDRGFDVVMDEYKKDAHFINDALEHIKSTYLSTE